MTCDQPLSRCADLWRRRVVGVWAAVGGRGRQRRRGRAALLLLRRRQSVPACRDDGAAGRGAAAGTGTSARPGRLQQPSARQETVSTGHWLGNVSVVPVIVNRSCERRDFTSPGRSCAV